MNLILENTQETMGVEEGVENWRALGLVIVKGSQVHLQLNRFRASV
jgi:small nuclear ribonucleoprotein (snRNP)-like protein